MLHFHSMTQKRVDSIPFSRNWGLMQSIFFSAFRLVTKWPARNVSPKCWPDETSPQRPTICPTSSASPVAESRVDGLSIRGGKKMSPERRRRGCPTRRPSVSHFKERCSDDPSRRPTRRHRRQPSTVPFPSPPPLAPPSLSLSLSIEAMPRTGMVSMATACVKWLPQPRKGCDFVFKRGWPFL